MAIRPLDHNSRIRVSSIHLSRTSYYENSLSKYFFPTSCFTQEREKFKYRRATYKIRRQVFFVLRVAQVKKAKEYFLRQATYKGTYVKAVESARAGLSPQEGDVRKKKRKRPRKARRWLPRRQGSVCPTPRIYFFGSRVFGF